MARYASANQIRALRTFRDCYPIWEARQSTPNPLGKDTVLATEAHEYITKFHLYGDPILPRNKSGERVAYWTNEAICTAMLIECGGDVDRAYEEFLTRRMLGDKLVFSANVNGTRVPKPMAEQMSECHKLLTRLAKNLGKNPPEKVEDSEKQESKIDRTGGEKDSPADLLKRLFELRDFCEKRNADGTPLDDVGLRPFVNGAKMWRKGISVDHIMDSLTMHYPKDARSELRITEQTTDHYVPKARTFEGKIPEKKNGGQHGAIGYVDALVDARVPVLLIGGKGTGKTTLAKAVADRLGLEFGSVNCNASLPTGVFYGRENFVEGRIEMAKFERIVRDGGVWLFDELDAGDPNTLLIVNEVLANRRFENPKTGVTTPCHENFIAIAAANTMGTGANRNYTGRERLDSASLDRWSAGRVRIGFDETLAHDLFWQEIAS